MSHYINALLNYITFHLVHVRVILCIFAGLLHLNRQVILLMSGLSVPDESFFKLQEEVLKKLADMLVYEEKAVEALSKVFDCIIFSTSKFIEVAYKIFTFKILISAMMF